MVAFEPNYGMGVHNSGDSSPAQTFACAAYNLVRMRNLMRSTVPA